MLIVPTNISNTFKMTDFVPNAEVEDLEDGEIESEGEEACEATNDVKNVEIVPTLDEKLSLEKPEHQDFYYSKSGKKKKSKSNKGEQKREKSKKSRKYSSPNEDDFAGSIEKAIRKAMNKNDVSESLNEGDVDERRKHKKRKKQDGKEGTSKKRKKQTYSDEVDESEMMCVRGASPVNRQSPVDNYPEDDRDSYASDSSHDQQHHRQPRQNKSQRDRNKNNKNDRRRGAHPMQDPDGVCLYYMQGKCHKGDDCLYSHDAQPPRKMELCKFYLMDCCAKRDKCLYMHADFPCKYYHTGLPCIYKEDCKFAHGKPLNEALKNILLKHIESAPKEILGDFPRLNREGALKMIQNTQNKLIQQYSETPEAQEKPIPSLFELNIPNPQNMPDSLQNNQYLNDRQVKGGSKISPKARQSRWQNEASNQTFNLSSNSITGTTNILSIKNLTGVLTPRQISDLTKMGIENLDQLGQLTVLQLNSIGLSLKQITEIQLNTMNIQKLGLITNNEPQQLISQTNTSKDLDLRVPPLPLPVTNNITVSSDFPEKDVDMRFQPALILPRTEESVTNKNQKEILANKDSNTIDIDQYTKDALKFASKDKENNISNESFDCDKPIISNESKDVDHRVLPFSDEGPRILHSTLNENNARKECDTDIRFLQPEPLFKSPEKRHRRSTTDDEDNNLLIDEKWYSSDEEKGIKKKSPASSPQQTPPSPQAPLPHVIEPSVVLSKLGDLSKIDISEEVTKLLNTMKNNLHENKLHSNAEGSASPQSLRDPRSRRSPEKVSDSNIKSITKKSSRISIYECVDGEPTDGRRRSDVDLRKSEFNLPSFGDTDLRQTSGDIDFRLGLPFKPLPNYTPASEINGSINSHPPISYRLVPIEIPRPDYTDIRNSTAKSQALVDPRLRKVFRLSLEESNSDSEKSTKTTVSTTTTLGPRIDPRRKPKDSPETLIQDQKPTTLDLQTILQTSNWYRDLSSTQKIYVNQNLAPVTQMVKQFQQEKVPGKKIDLASIHNNTALSSIFSNLGVSLSDNGEFSYLPKPKEALLKTPVNFNQTPFGINNMPGPPNSMDGGNMNMINMPSMGMGGMNNMNLGNMHGFNQPMQDPRSGPTPGLLGIAPNIPHNFNKFGAPNNFGTMPFNGPGPVNDFNFMDGEQNYPRFPNRGGHRGRGNDRWNRGSGGRGQRERKNFNNDRGNWKNDRN